MKIVMQINTDNAAFEDFDTEVERILRDLADRAGYLGINKPLVIRDINGNIVGELELIK